MSGLLLKDYYVLLKQAKIFLLVLLVFSLLPGYSMTAFAIVYASMLPITSLGYDERSKWNQYAAMLPYRKQDLILSKYYLALICLFAVTVLSLASGYVVAFVQGTPVDSQLIPETLSVVCVALVLTAINLPLMLKLGVEKGRLFFLLLAAGTAIFIVAVAEQMAAFLDTFSSATTLVIVALLLSLALLVISYFMALVLCKNKHE